MPEVIFARVIQCLMFLLFCSAIGLWPTSADLRPASCREKNLWYPGYSEVDFVKENDAIIVVVKSITTTFDSKTTVYIYRPEGNYEKC